MIWVVKQMYDYEIFRHMLNGPGIRDWLNACPWTTLLSSPQALENLPVLWLHIWTCTKFGGPQMLPGGQILCPDMQDDSYVFSIKGPTLQEMFTTIFEKMLLGNN